MTASTELIVTMRTDNPEAELGVYIQGNRSSYDTWHAHRELAETIHTKLHALLASNQKTFADVTAIVCYQGPGSFTGLRIGMSVANALAYGLSVPIVSTTGDNWIVEGIDKIATGESDFPAQPFYGAPVHITAQKK